MNLIHLRDCELPPVLLKFPYQLTTFGAWTEQKINPTLLFLHTVFYHIFRPEGFLKCSIKFRTGGALSTQP